MEVSLEQRSTTQDSAAFNPPTPSYSRIAQDIENYLKNERVTHLPPCFFEVYNLGVIEEHLVYLRGLYRKLSKSQMIKIGQGKLIEILERTDEGKKILDKYAPLQAKGSWAKGKSKRAYHRKGGSTLSLLSNPEFRQIYFEDFKGMCLTETRIIGCGGGAWYKEYSDRIKTGRMKKGYIPIPEGKRGRKKLHQASRT